MRLPFTNGPRRALEALGWTALLLLPLALTGCSRSAAPAGVPKVNLAFEKYTLPNGLEVVLR